MHSKFLGHQITELLTDSARQAIEQHSDFYTWVSQNGRKEEVEGLMILALILYALLELYLGTYVTYPYLEYLSHRELSVIRFSRYLITTKTHM
jgi:hypothetical protein